MRADPALVAGTICGLTHDGSNYSAEEKSNENRMLKVAPALTYVNRPGVDSRALEVEIESVVDIGARTVYLRVPLTFPHRI